VKPLPFVTEVLFLATPHRGSYLAGPQLVRRLAAYFVRLPSDIVRLGSSVTALASTGANALAYTRMPTRIDGMSPGQPFIKKLASIPVTPTVKAHSIISVDDDSPLDRAGDGVVKYESAHIDGVASELIVRSPHSGMQDAPQTIEEVRRILLEHSAKSAPDASRLTREAQRDGLIGLVNDGRGSTRAPTRSCRDPPKRSRASSGPIPRAGSTA
jgi:hypothetical protein